MDTPKKTKRRRNSNDPIIFTGKCALEGTPAEQDAALKALASIVVDELMLLRKMGLTPAQIRAMYQAEEPGATA